MTDSLDESLLTPATTAPSPFLPNTNIQFAWDSTSLGYIKTCPRLYQYIMIDGWAPRDQSVHLTFGAYYHAALEHFDRLLTEGHDREDAIHEMVRALLDNTVEYSPNQDIKAGKYKNRESLLQLVLDYVDHFNPDPAVTYIKSDGTPAVELSFRFELEWGPTSIEPSPEYIDGKPTVRDAQPYLLCGHLDRVVSFNSSLFVLDRKTTTSTLNASYFSNYSPNNQMSLYSFASRIILDAPIRGVIIDGAQIKLQEPNAFSRAFTTRTEAQLEEWHDDLRTTLAIAETYAANQYWPMNDTSCDKFGGCQFREICSKDPNVRERFLATDFIKLEEKDRWNPLRSR